MKQKQDDIFNALGSFPKVELEDIQRFFGAGVPSRIRKSEFVSRLGAYIIEKPSEWLSRMLERDLRLLKRLVDAGPGVPSYLEYPDYPSVLETVKLLGSDTSDSNFRKIWISEDLYDIVAPFIDQALEEGETSGRFDMERAALGYLNLYGVMTVDDFGLRMLEYEEFIGDTDTDAFLMRLYESPVMKLCRVDLEGERYMTSPNVFDPAEVLKGRKEYSEVSKFKDFTPQQALEAGKGAPYFVFGLGTSEGKDLVIVLQEDLGYSGDDLVREEHDIWINSQFAMDEQSTEAVFVSVNRKQDELETFEEYNACMHVVASYANSLPKWLLKGYSPNEVNCLKVVLQTDGDPLQELLKKNPLLGLFIPPVPADSPCPCGSGLSYRHCHGKLCN